MRWKCRIILLLLLFQCSPAWAEVVVIIRREAQSAGKYVRIGDIARVDGPDSQVREIAGTILGPAPSNGETRTITRWDIESRLLEMGILTAVAFSGNDHVRVLGAGALSGGSAGGDSQSVQNDDEFQYIPLGPVPGSSHNQGRRNRDQLTLGEPPVGSLRPDAQKTAKALPDPVQFDLSRTGTSKPGRPDETAGRRLSDAVAGYLGDRYRQGKNRDDIEIEARILSVDAAVPHDAAEIVVEEALDGRVPGKAELRVRLRDRPDSSPRSVMVVADTTVFAPALVAVHNISRGESLYPRDVTVSRIKMESGKAYLPPNPDAVEGREAMRAIRTGEAILAQDAKPGEAVKRGSMVIVKSIGKGWEIQSKAKAQGAGSVGDIITVEDSSTRNKFPARIVGRGMVEVVVNRDFTKIE